MSMYSAKITANSSTISSEITETLRDAIITGELPQGSKLSETKLARDLDVSRGPLREAIRNLEGMNLIEHVPQQGARVVILNMQTILEIYDTREALESKAAALAEVIESALLRRLYHLIKMFRYQHEFASTSTSNSLLEHRQIVYAIEQRDAELAEVTVKRHIIRARDRIERRLKAAQQDTKKAS